MKKRTENIIILAIVFIIILLSQTIIKDNNLTPEQHKRSQEFLKEQRHKL